MMETHRLIFRQYTMEDLDFLMTMTSDSEVMKYIGKGVIWSELETIEKLKRFINCYSNEEGIGLMLAIRKEDGKLVGHAGLVSQLVEDKQETEIGYWISKEFWGHGFAKESAIGWRDVGFEKLKKNKLISLIQYENKPSIQVAINNGMEYEREVKFNSKSIALYSIER